MRPALTEVLRTTSSCFHPMEIKILNSLDPLNDARDRRGSGCEWSRLNVVSHDHGLDPFAKAHFSEQHNLKVQPIVRG